MSCVPASCFHIWLVSCPRFMSLLVNSVPGVCVWLWVYYHVYLSPVCWVPCRLVYSLFPVFLSVYLALSYLDGVIKNYYFEVSPHLRVPRFSLLCAPWPLLILTCSQMFFFVVVCILLNQIPAPQMMNPDDFLQTVFLWERCTNIRCSTTLIFYGKTRSLTTDYVFFFLNPWK